MDGQLRRQALRLQQLAVHDVPDLLQHRAAGQHDLTLDDLPGLAVYDQTEYDRNT
ncbi:hypothetical protein D3C80_1771740 [compost metagenome]